MRNTFRIAVRKFDPFESAIAKQWEEFNKVFPTNLTLELESFDLHPLYEVLFHQNGLASGDFDVAFLNTDWLATASANQLVCDLSAYIAAQPPQGYPEAWAPSLLRLQTFAGSVLGLPYHDGPECLICRTDLFSDEREQQDFESRFGCSLRIPTTWEEFRRVARFFHRPEKNLWGTAFAGFPDGHNTVYDFLLQLWTRNGSLQDASGSIRFDSVEAAEALEFYRAMMQDPEAVHPGSLDFDSVQLGQAFARGEIAMMVNWFGFAVWAETSPDSPARNKIQVAPVPHHPQSAAASLNIYWLLAIAAGCPRPDLAYRFLRHCSSPAMDKLLTLEGAVGCRRSTWNDAEVRDLVPHFRHLETLHADARELPQLAEWPRIASIMDGFVHAAATSREPVGKLLREADRQISQLHSN